MPLDPPAAIQNLAVITKASSKLSQTLSEIAFGVVNSSMSLTITKVAGLFAELADLAKTFGERLALLNDAFPYVVTEKLLEDSGTALSWLDQQVKAYEAIIIGKSRRHEFKRTFREENRRDLTSTLRAIKQPLKLNLSVLLIAHEYEKRQSRKRSKKKRHSQDVTALTRECELAESWVEACKEVVKELQIPHNHSQDTDTNDVLPSKDSRETDTIDVLPSKDAKEDSAAWVYKVVFNRALHSIPATKRLNAKGGHVKTVETVDANASASDSEHDDFPDHLPEDLKRELWVTVGLKELVVDELIQTWTGLDPESIRVLTNPMRNEDKKDIKTSATKMVQWLIKNEKSAQRDGSPQPTHKGGKPSQGGQDYTGSRGATESKPSDDPSRSAVPEAGAHQPPPYDQTMPERSEDKTIPKESSRSHTVNNHPSAPEPQSSTAQKPRSQSGNPSNRQIPRKATVECGDDDDDRPDDRPHSYTVGFDPKPNPDTQRGRHRPVSMLPNPRRSDGYMDPYVIPSHFGPTPAIGIQSVPPSIPSGSGYGSLAYNYPMPPLMKDGYPSGHREHRGVPKDEENTKVAKLAQRMDEKDKEEKALEQARKDEEKIRKEEARKVAEEYRKVAEEYRQQLEAQKQVVDDLRRDLQTLQESKQQEDEEKREKERRSLERQLEEQRISEQQAHERVGVATDAHAEYHTDSRLWALVTDLRENERSKTKEWEEQRSKIAEKAEEEKKRIAEEAKEEKNRIVEKAEEEVERIVDECEEAKQTIISEYQEKLRVAEENVRNAKKAAEYYVGLYNKMMTSRHEEPATVSRSTTASEAHADVFDYEQKHWNSSSGSSIVNGSAFQSETVPTNLDMQNPWADKSPYDRFAPQHPARRNTMSMASRDSDDASNVIIFPPRAGWSEFGPNQLGNYLSSSGFKAMFEERQRPVQDARGRFEKIGSGGNVLRGTLFWQPPASTAEADLYKSFRSCGWRPTYVRKTVSGQTWFFGAQPVHAQFFSDMYTPQVTPLNMSRPTPGSEREFLIISKDLIEVEELDSLGHTFKEQDGKIFLDPTLTPEDIDHIVARSFLAQEGRYRREFRKSGLRFSLPKTGFEAVTSEAPSESKERRLSLWPFSGLWST